MREEVNYFYYLARGSADDLARQCHDGVARGYTVYYKKTGIDHAAHEEMLEAHRLQQGVDGQPVNRRP